MYLSIDPERYIYIYAQLSSLARVALYNQRTKGENRGRAITQIL